MNSLTFRGSKNDNPSISLKIIMDTLFNFQAGVSNRIQNNVLWIPLFFFLKSDCVSKSAYPKKNGAYPKKRIQTYSIVSKRMQISVSKNPNVSKKCFQTYPKKADLTFLQCTCWVKQTNVQFLHVFIPLPTLIFLFEKSLLLSSLH